MKLLNTFKQYGYSNQIGPGVYDIHSPRVPSEQEIKDRIAAMLETLPDNLVVINPVCFSLCFVSESHVLYLHRTVVSRPVAGRRRRVRSHIRVNACMVPHTRLSASLSNLVNAARWARKTYA